MSKVVRMISTGGELVITAIDSTDICGKAEQIHESSAVVTAALGRLLTAASLMGIMLKSKDESVTLRIDGKGPASPIIAVSDSDGNVRGYTGSSVVEIPLNNVGKLDVGGAVGKNGFFTVIKDLGLETPYTAQIPIISGEIAEEVTQYYATSEQFPTVCALGVLVDTNLTVKKAGGFLLSLLPGADDSIIDIIENNVMALKSVTGMLEDGLDVYDICKKVCDGIEIDVLDEFECDYKCYCSKEKVMKALASIGKEELEDMIEKDHGAQLHCHFCNKFYDINEKELLSLIN